MKELFYFSNSDLMIQVQNDEENNSLKYTSHREISSGERELVERYLRNNFANSVFNLAELDYVGINRHLEKNLSQLQVKQKTPPKSPPVSNKKAEKAVRSLISDAMSTYYFDRIGDKLIEMKQDPNVLENLTRYKTDLLDLVSAYNVHAVKKITLYKVLPKEFI